MPVVMIHYASEIALKGGNRRNFENQLIENIRKALGKNLKKISKPYGRIVAEAEKKAGVEKALKSVFGISWFSFAKKCKSDFESIRKLVLKQKIAGASFCVQAKRADKRFPIKSPEINKLLGQEIAGKLKLKVDYKNPETTIFVEITEDGAFVYSEKIRGAGGLPVGTSGKVLVLLSGGIDSAVASYLIMKRGCSADYLHFHALKSAGDVKKSKISRIVKALKIHCPKSKLYLAPYHKFDVSVQKAPDSYHLILFRRFMFKTAEAVAEKIGAKAIVSGDNLAQVASQTLENISVVDEGVKTTIFRPLLTYDKEEVIQLAKQIGHYELAIEPYKDCCSIVSKHSATKANLKKVKYYEKIIGMDKIAGETINNLQALS